MIKRPGFTLIEMLVVVSVLGVVMITLTSIMLSSFQAKNRSEITNRIEQNGAMAVSELRRNVLNSSGASLICPDGGVGSSMTVVSKFDGQASLLSCQTAAIASISAATGQIVDLTGLDVQVTDCDTFVSCDTEPSSGEVRDVNFDFKMQNTIAKGDTSPTDYITREFSTEVVVRN